MPPPAVGYPPKTLVRRAVLLLTVHPVIVRLPPPSKIAPPYPLVSSSAPGQGQVCETDVGPAAGDIQDAVAGSVAGVWIGIAVERDTTAVDRDVVRQHEFAAGQHQVLPSRAGRTR